MINFTGEKKKGDIVNIKTKGKVSRELEEAKKEVAKNDFSAEEVAGDGRKAGKKRRQKK